jgi:hypothetical protein
MEARAKYETPKHEHPLSSAYVRVNGGWKQVGWWCAEELGMFRRSGYVRGLPKKLFKDGWRPRVKAVPHSCSGVKQEYIRPLSLYVDNPARTTPRKKVVAYWCPGCARPISLLFLDRLKREGGVAYGQDFVRV